MCRFEDKITLPLYTFKLTIIRYYEHVHVKMKIQVKPDLLIFLIFLIFFLIRQANFHGNYNYQALFNTLKSKKIIRLAWPV